jgi:hypothetical protein
MNDTPLAMIASLIRVGFPSGMVHLHTPLAQCPNKGRDVYPAIVQRKSVAVKFAEARVWDAAKAAARWRARLTTDAQDVDLARDHAIPKS